MDNTQVEAEQQYIKDQTDPNAITEFTPQKAQPFPLSDVQQSVIANNNPANKVSIVEPDTPTGAPVSLMDNGIGALPPASIARSKAIKVAYATDGDPKELNTQIASGRENMVRDKLAFEADADWQRKKTQILKDTIAKSGGKLSTEEMNVLADMTREDFKNDPQTIFEKKYAERYVKDNVMTNVANAPTAGVWAKTYNANPVTAAKTMQQQSNLLTRVDTVNTMIEESEEERKSRGVVANTLSMLGGAMLGIHYANLASVLKEAPWSYLSLPGTIKAQQIASLWAIRDPVEFKNKVRETYETLKANNFIQAQEFIHAMRGWSDSSQFMLNSTGVLDISFLPVGKLASGAAKIVGSERLASKLFPKAEIPKEPLFTFAGGKEAYGSSIAKDTTLIPPIPEVTQDIVRQSEYTIQPNLFSNLPEQRPQMIMNGRAMNRAEPGQFPNTPKAVSLEQQAIDSEKRSKLAGRSPATGRFEPGQGNYYQTEFELDQPGVRAGFDQNSFKLRNETYLASDGRLMNAQTGTELTTPFERYQLKMKLDDAIDQQIAFHGITQNSTRTSDFLSNSAHAAPTGTTGVPTGIISKTAEEAPVGRMERDVRAWDNAEIRPVDMLPGHTNATGFFGENTLYNKAIAAAKTRQAELEQVLDDTLKIRRISEVAEKDAAKLTASRQFQEFGPKYGDGVIDAVYLPSSLFKSNTAQSVLRLGDPETKAPFLSRAQAELAAKDKYNLPASDYQIYIGKNNDFYIGLRANVAENTDRTLNLVYEMREARNMGMIPWLRSRAEILDSWISGPEMAQRKVATHAQQEIKRVVTNNSEVFNSLSKNDVSQLNQTLSDYGIKRQWFETKQDFEKEFLARHKTLPNQKQVEAAFFYKQLQDYDYMIRNAGVYRDWARQGAENHSLMIAGKESDSFKGIVKDSLPWGHGDQFSFAIYKQGDSKALTEQSFEAGRIAGPTSKEEVDKLLKDPNKPFKVIQLGEPGEKPLAKLGVTDENAFVHYLVTDADVTKPLPWQQLKYEPGPHSIYPQQYYIKQGKLATGLGGRDYYYGDNTLWMYSTRAEATKWFDRLETARQKVIANAPDAEDYITKNLPYNSLKEFNELRNHFNLEHPFSLTERGHSVFESDEALHKIHPNAIDFHNSSHNPMNFMDRSFMQERDASVKVPVEQAGKMIFQPAQQLDAMSALDKGLNQSIRGMWLNDEKVRSATQWIENYKDVLDMTADKARAIPLWALNHGKFINVAPSSPLYAKVVAAEAERAALKNFIGQQTDWGLEVGNLQAKLMDSLYEKGGKDLADAASTWSLSYIKDPTRFFRQVAASFNLGFFNPMPMVQQAMAHINVMAVAPEHAIKSTTAAWLFRSLEHTGEEAIINKAADWASMTINGGWNKDWFKEALTGYRNSGMDVVGKEATLRNDLLDAPLWRNNVLNQVAANKGFMFWNAGERLTRKTSYAASYLEWRTANPTAQFTEEAQASVMQRASLMTGHMNVASQSAWESGQALAMTTQFTSWYSHMAQLMMGKELTFYEKARMIAANSLVFGIPAGLGVGGIPGALTEAATSAAKVYTDQRSVPAAVAMTAAGALGFGTPYDDIREFLRLKGWDDKASNGVIQFMMKGLPNFLMQHFTGKDPDIAKNFAGSGVNGYVRDILRRDKGFFDVLEGASGQVLGGIFSSFMPMTYKAMAGTPPSSDDWVRVASNVKTFDLAHRIYYAYAYNTFITGPDSPQVRNIDMMDKVLTALRISPKQYQDSIINIGTRQDVTKDSKEFEKMAVTAQRNAIRARMDGDTRKAYEYDKEAEIFLKAGNFNLAKRGQISKQSAKEAFGFEYSTEKSLNRALPETERTQRALPQHFRMEP